jgi:hypothetical protein
VLFCCCAARAARARWRRSSPRSRPSAPASASPGRSARSHSRPRSTSASSSSASGLLTACKVSWRQLRDGAIAAGILYELLQKLGGYYVGHTLKHASNVYGTFGLAIGLLSWIYLSAHITLLAAEGNVVATRRLSPRSFSLMTKQPPTQADERALTQRGKVEEGRQDETVSVDLSEAPPRDDGSDGAERQPRA